MRVYGALMWSLGKVLNTPEVMRVYIGCVRNTYGCTLNSLISCISLIFFLAYRIKHF